MKASPPRVLRREWTTAEGWRGTRAGMWAWLIQRAAAIALLVSGGLFAIVWLWRWY